MERLSTNLEFLDLNPKLSDFRSDVLAGLGQKQKCIPPKYFYDKRGSEIYDAICELDEYYPTRTELSILEKNADAISRLMESDCTLLEFGCGSSLKIRRLLSLLDHPAQYVPIDISKEYLKSMALDLAKDFPQISMLAVCADYTDNMDIAPYLKNPKNHRVIFFPGSTIGNLIPEERDHLLKIAARVAGSGGGLLIGVDLRKDVQTLTNAYSDAKGVTAAFNKNVLVRINEELGGEFPLAEFQHKALYNKDHGRVEMHLVSQKEQTVAVNGEAFSFNKGESIHTECSYKYTVEGFAEVVRKAGFTLKKTWVDDKKLFSVHYLMAD